jgi:NAD(P)-dependent dehydrogenase (short-subunit alcohol dehydrogenase family)
VLSSELGNVVITGGSSGLGAALSEAVGRVGGRPFILDRIPPPGGHAYELVDLADSSAAEKAVERAALTNGGLDALVTCAGMDACGSLGAVSREDWERVVKVNLLGTAAVVRAALPHLEQSRGHIVTVASTLGLRVMPDATAYCASKFGVVGFTRALAAETAGRVGVTLLVPGGMNTAFFEGREDRYKPAAEAQLNRPQDVAAAVIFALAQPPGCEVRELVVTPSRESSWP